MQFFGLTFTRTKTLQPVASVPMYGSTRGWWRVFGNTGGEANTGDWQRNIDLNRDEVLGSSVVFACLTLIAGDIAKLWLDLVSEDSDGISTPVKNLHGNDKASQYLTVLKKPNHFQNRVQFILHWILSKLIHGNTYALKERDGNGIVRKLYLLDPCRVQPLVSPDGAVFYQVDADALAGVEQRIVIPARELIHDRMYTFFHPLLGVGPLLYAALSAMQGLKIQNQSAKLFQNNLLLAGVLTAPGKISEETAKKLEDHWNEYYGGEAGAGRVAALGDGLTFQPMMTRAIDAQLIEQLNYTAADICRVFHVPAYKVGVGPYPAFPNLEALSTDYYQSALQILIEALEICLDEGLEIAMPYRSEVDLEALLRMDTASAVDTAAKGVGAAIYTPNEARAKLNLGKVDGGDTPWLQQQNWPLKILAERETPTEKPTEPAPMDPNAKMIEVMAQWMRPRDEKTMSATDARAALSAAISERLQPRAA